MSITFSSCFYIIKSKFSPNTYIEWMTNFLSIVNHFNLVIYTDEASSKYIPVTNNPRMKIIIKPLEKFYNYKYKDYWIANHEKNVLLKDAVNWEVNMLWSEKTSFVEETYNNKYFNTEFYGWCDIGYFRNRENDTHTDRLCNWANETRIATLDKKKIYYACINNDNKIMELLTKIVNNKNKLGLPVQPIPDFQNSVAGGFFIIHKNKVEWWKNEYDDKLRSYFKNGYLVKDDQIILIDYILTKGNEKKFCLLKENDEKYDNWFLFQRFLC